MGLSNAERVPGPQNQPDDRQSASAGLCDRDGTCALRQGLDPGTERLVGVGVVGAQQSAQRVRRRAQVQFLHRTRAVRPHQHGKHSRQRERRIL